MSNKLCPPIHGTSFTLTKGVKTLVNRFFNDIDKLPDDFFPDRAQLELRAQQLLEPYKSEPEASCAGIEFKLLWWLRYLSANADSVEDDIITLQNAVEFIIGEFQKYDDSVLYVDGGIDLSKIYNNPSVIDASCSFRSDTADPYIPFTYASYLDSFFGCSTADQPDAQTKLQRPERFETLAEFLLTVEDEFESAVGVTYPLQQFADMFNVDLPRMAAYPTGASTRERFLIGRDFPYGPDYFKEYFIDKGLIPEAGLQVDFTIENVLEKFQTVFSILERIISSIHNFPRLRRLLWLTTSGLIFGWDRMEQYFIDFNVWQSLPTAYRGPIPKFNEYVTNTINGTPLGSSGAKAIGTSRKSMGRKKCGKCKSKPCKCNKQ